MRPTGTPQQLEKRRLQAIQLIKQGKSKAEVARWLGTSRMSVNRWFLSYEKEGKHGLSSRTASGRPPKLSAKQKKKLSGLLLKGPLSRGYSTELWTLGRIARMILQEFRIEYHPNHIWRILGGMGWSCQKPERRALQRSEEKIEHWKRYRWPQIKKNSKTWCPHGLPG